MSRGRKTGGVSDAAAIPPGVPNATSLAKILPFPPVGRSWMRILEGKMF